MWGIGIYMGIVGCCWVNVDEVWDCNLGFCRLGWLDGWVFFGVWGREGGIIGKRCSCVLGYRVLED